MPLFNTCEGVTTLISSITGAGSAILASWFAFRYQLKAMAQAHHLEREQKMIVRRLERLERLYQSFFEWKRNLQETYNEFCTEWDSFQGHGSRNSDHEFPSFDPLREAIESGIATTLDLPLLDTASNNGFSGNFVTTEKLAQKLLDLLGNFKYQWPSDRSYGLAESYFNDCQKKFGPLIVSIDNSMGLIMSEIVRLSSVK